MNYYERHLGDYARDAAHLSMLEHGAYTLLLDRYYATESPIPEDQVYRIARARTPEECEAVDVVLAEFFVLEDGAYHQKRCDEEIARYRAGKPERELRKSNEAERQRKHRDERRKLFACLNSADQHPAYNTPMPTLRKLHERHCNGACAHVTLPVTPVTRDRPSQQSLHVTPVTRTATATINPDTSNPDTSNPDTHNARAREARVDDASTTREPRERDACTGERKGKEGKGKEGNIHSTRDARVDHAQFERVKAAYPRFAGRQDWINAEHACHNRIEQDAQTWDDLVAAAERYARYCDATGRTGTNYVMSPGRFFSAADRPWLQPWDPPKRNGHDASVSRSKSAEQTENEYIERYIRQGLTDAEIAQLDDFAATPNLLARVRAIRREIEQHEQH